MAENDTNLPGGLPPKPAESPKVQPKKETVRISLPPKPAPSATIKLPTMPSAPAAPAAPPSAPGVAAAHAPVPPTSGARPPLGVAPPGGTRPATRGPAARPIGPAPAAGMRPAPGAALAAAPKAMVSGLDIGLAVAAAVLGLGAVAYTWFNLYMN